MSLFTLSWALAIFFRKLALNLGAHPITFLLQSGFMSGVILTTYILLIRRNYLRTITHSTVRLLIVMALLVGGAWITDTWGLKLTTSINYSLIIKSGLIFSLLFSVITLKERITRQKWLLAIIMAMGVYFITTRGERIAPRYGDLLIVLAALLYSAGSTVEKILTRAMHPDIIAWLRTVSGVMILFTVQVTVGHLDWRIVAPLYIAIVGILLCFTTIFLLKSLAVAELSYLTLMTMLVPVINTILGVTFLGETMNDWQVLGGIIIIVSGVLIHRIHT